ERANPRAGGGGGGQRERRPFRQPRAGRPRLRVGLRPQDLERELPGQLPGAGRAGRHPERVAAALHGIPLFSETVPRHREAVGDMTIVQTPHELTVPGRYSCSVATLGRLCLSVRVEARGRMSESSSYSRRCYVRIPCASRSVAVCWAATLPRTVSTSSEARSS